MRARIRPHSNDEKRDRELGTQVRRCLAQDSHRRFNRVKCRVDHGTVILSGHVATAIEQAVAMDAINRLDVVDGVINEIELLPTDIPAT